MKNPKCQKVIDHFNSGKSLTKLQCISLFNYINLGDIVYKLNKNAPDYIITTMKRSVLGERYAEYKLNPKYV